MPRTTAETAAPMTANANVTETDPDAPPECPVCGEPYDREQSNTTVRLAATFVPSVAARVCVSPRVVTVTERDGRHRVLNDRAGGIYIHDT